MNELSEIQRRSSYRLAVGFAVMGLLLTALAIPAQAGVVAVHSALWWASVGCAIIAGILWLVALCLVSRARGYHPLWGLTLLIPPFILMYPFVFPNRYRKDKHPDTDDAA
jgi:hypothetical protein